MEEMERFFHAEERLADAEDFILRVVCDGSTVSFALFMRKMALDETGRELDSSTWKRWSVSSMRKKDCSKRRILFFVSSATGALSHSLSLCGRWHWMKPAGNWIRLHGRDEAFLPCGRRTARSGELYSLRCLRREYGIVCSVRAEDGSRRRFLLSCVVGAWRAVHW